jgi:hypothetical protein
MLDEHAEEEDGLFCFCFDFGFGLRGRVVVWLCLGRGVGGVPGTKADVDLNICVSVHAQKETKNGV